MNLPNKLTVLRVIMVPFFVFFMLTDRQSQKSCNQFRKVYGSAGR